MYFYYELYLTCFNLSTPFSGASQTCVRQSSSSIVIINFASSSNFLPISNPYKEKKGNHSEDRNQGSCKKE